MSTNHTGIFNQSSSQGLILLLQLSFKAVRHFMPPKIKCAVYSYIKRSIWDLSEDDDKAMMTVPPGKIRATTTDNGLKVELLKCTPLENMKEKDGKLEQRFRYLACVAVGDSNGSIGIGEKIATSRKLAESRAKEEAMKNFCHIGKELFGSVEGKCGKVSITINPSAAGSGCTGSILALKLLELLGMTDCDVVGSNNSLSFIRAFNKALRKIK